MSKFMMEQVGKAFESTWALCVKHEIAILTVNVAGMAFVAERVEDPGDKFVIAITFIIGNALGIVVLAGLLAYSWWARDQFDNLGGVYASQQGGHAVPVPGGYGCPLPHFVAISGSVIYILAHLLLSVCWFIMGFSKDWQLFAEERAMHWSIWALVPGVAGLVLGYSVCCCCTVSSPARRRLRRLKRKVRPASLR